MIFAEQKGKPFFIISKRKNNDLINIIKLLLSDKSFNKT